MYPNVYPTNLTNGYKVLQELEPVLCQTRKTTKRPHPLYVAKKYVETYFSCNAAVLDPEERVSVTIIDTV